MTAEQNELWEELKVEHHWFHVVRSMIMRGKLGEMGVNAWAVYSVLKAHTALDTGKSWPSQSRIAQLLGVSVDTVARATDRLEELGIVTKEKHGNKNHYRLTEEIPMTDAQGELVAVASRDYSPMAFKGFIDELQAWAKNGNNPLSPNIKITINANFIQQGDNSTVNIQQVTVTDDEGRADDRYTLLARRLKNL
jgi:DNA-binding Lrp family transcriptional regulator